MKDEIEVEEYVRTDKGYIFKVDIENKNLQIIDFLDVEYGKMVNHSKDIIELIEVGDIVSTYERLSLQEYDKYYIHNEDMLKALKQDIKNGDIQLLGILTKEQMASIEYRVEEDK